MDTPELLFEALGCLGFSAVDSSNTQAPDAFLKRPNSMLQDAILHFLYVAYKGAKGRQVAQFAAPWCTIRALCRGMSCLDCRRWEFFGLSTAPPARNSDRCALATGRPKCCSFTAHTMAHTCKDETALELLCWQQQLTWVRRCTGDPGLCDLPDHAAKGAGCRSPEAAGPGSRPQVT